MVALRPDLPGTFVQSRFYLLSTSVNPRCRRIFNYLMQWDFEGDEAGTFDDFPYCRVVEPPVRHLFRH